MTKVPSKNCYYVIMINALKCCFPNW